MAERAKSLASLAVLKGVCAAAARGCLEKPARRDKLPAAAAEGREQLKGPRLATWAPGQPENPPSYHPLPEKKQTTQPTNKQEPQTKPKPTKHTQNPTNRQNTHKKNQPHQKKSTKKQQTSKRGQPSPQEVPLVCGAGGSIPEGRSPLLLPVQIDERWGRSHCLQPRGGLLGAGGSMVSGRAGPRGTVATP